MTRFFAPATDQVIRLFAVGLQYGKVSALRDIDLDIPAGSMAGLIGPDGVGKSSLLALVCGARALQSGRIEVLGGDMRSARFRAEVCSRIAYMPQGLGKNLYPTLSVFENLDFFGRLFGHDAAIRKQRIDLLLAVTGLAAFAHRPAGKLSGGMKQKLGLCCALIHDPDLLVLDEPTTGVDPLSRRQFWALIKEMRAMRPSMSVLVATAYMDEAARFDWLAAMDAGRVLAVGTPAELMAQTACGTLEQAFIAMLPPSKRIGYEPVEIVPREANTEAEVAIEARDLSIRFGDFTAVERVNFRIHRGEIFGFLGSNGCGKTATMKMLTGLLPASEGEVLLFGQPLNPHDLSVRRRVGFMTQSFSLYGELTVRQNLVLHAQLYGLPRTDIRARVQEMVERFELIDIINALPDVLPLGERQRLSLAVAMIHAPEILILDEPTSGVDPVARDAFWRVLIELSRREGVTIFISTHFMGEAQRCDRISLMHAGHVLISDTPHSIMVARGAATLEDAFVSHLQEAESLHSELAGAQLQLAAISAAQMMTTKHSRRAFSPNRLLSFMQRERLELQRDPIRLSLAVLGSVLLMLVLGYGITMDVEDLPYAVLDRDQTSFSRDYSLSLSGSRYFKELPPFSNYAEMDRRMRAGEVSLAIEIPSGFGGDLLRGRPVQIGAWIDGSMPQRAETVRGYVQGLHQHWLSQHLNHESLQAASVSRATVETRFRYNPDVRSLPAMVPAVIPLLLMLIPAILAALSVVREKELGSIINFYVTPATRLEFLLGKQIPYVVLAMASFFLLVLIAVVLFDVPVTGSFGALTLGALLYVISATALGLLISSFVRSQAAALFGTALLTVLPAVQFSGLIDPISSLQGLGRLIGEAYPTTHFVDISRGVFSKALLLGDLVPSFVGLLIGIPVLMGLAVALLRKQQR